MAGDATDTTFGVLRINRIHMLRVARMTSQAPGIDFFRGMLFENENLGLIAAAGNVRRPGTVAPFASLAGWTAFRI
jgi:hypothetical protein